MSKKQTDSEDITIDTPLIVGNLHVFPNKFRYKKIQCVFRDISHLDWYVPPQTSNPINNQKVRLIIYVVGDVEPIKITKTSLHEVTKLIAAYNFISEQTFQTRLERYTKLFEQKGYFSYYPVTIYSDGKVVKNGNKVFFLQNAQIEPFKVTIKQGGFFSSTCNLSTTLNNDVINCLIDFILKTPQNPESIRGTAKRRKNAKDSIGKFLENLICMLAKISKADGVVTIEEIDVIKKFFHNDLKLDDNSYGVAISIFNDAKNDPEPIELHARNVFKDIGNDTNMLISIVDLLFSVAIADDHFSAEEELMINKVETIFGVTGQTNYSSFQKEHSQRQKNQDNDDLKYYEILGLNIESDPSEIKITYRRLVMQYHPDRVQHLGPDFQALAEEKIKEIIIAYEYFQNKYNM